jgi:WD40 repeat protein
VGYTSSRSDVNGLAWSPDGRMLASAHQDGKVRLWNVADGEVLHTLGGHTGWVRGVAWSPDGRWLASTSEDRKVRLWDAETGQRLVTLKHSRAVWSVAWSPDGSRLAAGSGVYNKATPPGKVIVWAVPSPEDGALW